MFYGRNEYDFEEGVLQFMAPGKIVQFTEESRPSTYRFMLVFHPDLIRNFDLAKRMKEYNFFNYSVHESLHLSEKEERTMLDTVENIKDEHILEIAKTELAGTEKNINEVAYDLGFNYPHYFSRLFKKKTGMSPNEYRGQFLN